MKNMSLVIFDMDGLMFDTERIAISSWEKAGKDFGFEILPSMIIETIGLNIKGTEKVIREHFDVDFPFDKIRKRRFEYTQKHIADYGIPVKEGLYELLLFLKKNGILTAVATSTDRLRAESNLMLAGVIDKFDYIVCGDEVKKGKPEPDIFLAAAKGLNCDSKKCIVLEDSENGIKAAAGAGMLPILVPDIKMPSSEVKKLIYKEFKSLLEVRDFLVEIDDDWDRKTTG